MHKTTAFGESFAKLTASFENAKQMVYSMQKEKLGLQGVISEYEKRVMLLEKQVQGSVEEAAAIAKRLGDMRKL